MLGLKRLLVHQVAIERWIFKTQNLVVEILKVLVAHLLAEQVQVVSQDDLDFLCSNIAGSVSDLAKECVSVLRLLAELVTVLPKHFWHLEAVILLSIVNSTLAALPLSF